MTSLDQALDAVECRDDLASFVEALESSLKTAPQAWENADLSSYLSALAAWIRDMDGYFINTEGQMPSEPSWKMIAQMLMAACVYE
jgi:hypothetical protein